MVILSRDIPLDTRCCAVDSIKWQDWDLLLSSEVQLHLERTTVTECPPRPCKYTRHFIVLL
jgi:hypothetical protein